MVTGSVASEHADDDAKEVADQAEALDGSLASDPEEERLSHSVLEHDNQAVEDGKVVAEAFNQGVGSFTPDIFFQNLVNQYQNAKRLYGDTLIRALTGYDPEYVRKNVRIPEFQHALQQRVEENVAALQQRGVLDEQGFVTKKGVKLAALVTYAEELDRFVSKGLGKKEVKERDVYGEKGGVVLFQRGKDRFKDIAWKQSLKQAIRRGHTTLQLDDLRAHERERRGRIQIVYAMDASGSMRGEKLAVAKRAGVALAYRAIEEQNEVGLLVFTSKIEKAVAPTRDFALLLEELVKIRAGQETDLAKTITESTFLFSHTDCTKHLLLLTDAVPTRGEDPRQATLEAASAARGHGITISIVGINLDDEGESLARAVVELGGGRLYRVRSLEALDLVILEEYDALRKARS